VKNGKAQFLPHFHHRSPPQKNGGKSAIEQVLPSTVSGEGDIGTAEGTLHKGQCAT